MQKLNLDKLKRDCLIAVFIPLISLAIFQVMAQMKPSWGLIALATTCTFMFFWYLYRFFNRLEDMTWQQQVSCIVQKVSAPVLIADLKYNISFANDSFQHLPLSVALFRYNTLPELIAKEDKTQINSIKEALDSLSGKMKTQVDWSGITYEWVIVPLFSPAGKRWGTLVECVTKQNISNEQIDNESTEALACSTNPVVILDKSCQVQQASPALKKWFSTQELEGCNFKECVNALFPKLNRALAHALNNESGSRFIAEHENKFYDWVISPIKHKKQLLGYVIEIMSPSLQEILSIEESAVRLQNKKIHLEKELVNFSLGLAKVMLYQKGTKVELDELSFNDFHHPLLKSSSKNIKQLNHIMQKLYGEIEQLQEKSSTITEVAISNGSLPQVNLLASTVVRNVHEVKNDFTLLYQELVKLKGIIQDHKNLNQGFIKPVGKTIESTEEAIFHTVGYAETITLVLHQLHENQTYLLQLQELMQKLGKAAGSEAQQIYHDIIDFLDNVKGTLLTSKLKLTELLFNFDNLKGCWNSSLENLKSCLDLDPVMEQLSDRWSEANHFADDYSKKVQERVQNLIELTNRIHHKTTAIDSTLITIPEFSNNCFDHVVIAVDETKKRAEEVLLGSLKK